VSNYPPTIYVLGTDRSIGKTVVCMGIISNLITREDGCSIDDVGYMKPVGQQTVTVRDAEKAPIQADKDAVLVSQLVGIRGPDYESSSPVVWGSGVTGQFIDRASAGEPIAEREVFLTKIRRAYERVADGKRVVLAEGTGQPGVGSVAGIASADVIGALRDMGVPLYVILVTQGGIGSTIDQLFPYLMLLEHMQTRVDGIVVNGVFAAKVEKIRRYLLSYYERVFPALYGSHVKTRSAPPILGLVPYIPELRYPSIRLVKETLEKENSDTVEVIAPAIFDAGGNALVRDLKVISLEFGFEPFLHPGDAVIVGVNANDVILSILLLHERMVRKHGEGLSGLILSCKQVGGLARQIEEMLTSSDLPTLLVALDSATIVHKVEGMDVKIQAYDEPKKELIAAAFKEALSGWTDRIEPAPSRQALTSACSPSSVAQPAHSPICEFKRKERGETITD